MRRVCPSRTCSRQLWSHKCAFWRIVHIHNHRRRFLQLRCCWNVLGFFTWKSTSGEAKWRCGDLICCYVKKTLPLVVVKGIGAGAIANFLSKCMTLHWRNDQSSSAWKCLCWIFSDLAANSARRHGSLGYSLLNPSQSFLHRWGGTALTIVTTTARLGRPVLHVQYVYLIASAMVLDWQLKFSLSAANLIMFTHCAHHPRPVIHSASKTCTCSVILQKNVQSKIVWRACSMWSQRPLSGSSF